LLRMNKRVVVRHTNIRSNDNSVPKFTP